MKKALLILLLAASFAADAQSLKEALYGGKLKNQPGTVVRKGDDLAKLHAEKLESEKRVADSIGRADSVAKAVASVAADSAAVASITKTDSSSVGIDSAMTAKTGVPNETGEKSKEDSAVTEKAVDPKDNNALLKAYMDGLVTTLKAEVLSSKKVKEGSYYVLVSYAIETDGQLAITDVFVSPENEFMQKQIKERLALETPKLNPVLSSSGKARKVNKKYNFTLVKE